MPADLEPNVMRAVAIPKRGRQLTRAWMRQGLAIRVLIGIGALWPATGVAQEASVASAVPLYPECGPGLAATGCPQAKGGTSASSQSNPLSASHALYAHARLPTPERAPMMKCALSGTPATASKAKASTSLTRQRRHTGRFISEFDTMWIQKLTG
ncbi:MAG: hypothetical protein JOY71_12350 [Acetobacteraceae bacterium]|nr:hypothetical protein [Acetobacteraceae bacterium]MBV8522891.1 hypothetical protein [Acetobacteraceae bacterium]